jgi:hypothetical protein
MVGMEEMVVGAMDDQEMDLTPDRLLLHLILHHQVEAQEGKLAVAVIQPLDGLHTIQEVLPILIP